LIGFGPTEPLGTMDLFAEMGRLHAEPNRSTAARPSASSLFQTARVPRAHDLDRAGRARSER
jgi:hypothetical protein